MAVEKTGVTAVISPLKDVGDLSIVEEQLDLVPRFALRVPGIMDHVILYYTILWSVASSGERESEVVFREDA